MSAAYTACTIASPTFRAHARVLAESFLEHNPEAELVLVDLARVAADGRPREPERAADPRIEVLDPRELFDDPTELDRLGLAYSTQGLAGALKPRILAHLLAQGRGPALLIDADICVYRSLSGVVELAREHGAVLTAHMHHPAIETERPTLLAGVFNSGFLAVDESAADLLAWWSDRTRRDCVARPERGMLWEQSWLSLAPAFFAHTVLRDIGVNAMTESLSRDDVEWAAEGPSLGRDPLRCFHFSGPYDPAEPDYLIAPSPHGHDVVERANRLSDGHPLHWLSLRNRPGAARMSAEYGERLLAAGFEEARDAAAPYTALPGNPIAQRAIREAYRTALIEAERDGDPEPPNPFAGSSPERLVEWLAEPAPGEADGLTRFGRGIWGSFAGASTVFPQVPGPQMREFLRWAGRRVRGPESLPVPLSVEPRAAEPEAAPRRRRLRLPRRR